MILIVSVLLTLLFVIPMQSMPRISIGGKSDDENQETEETSNEKEDDKETDSKNEKNDSINNINAKTNDIPQPKKQSLLAHREVLEEIPEAEVEYEIQRDANDGLEEILEEEEDLDDETLDQIDDEELEVIEEEQGGEDFWEERNVPRTYSRNYDRDLEEWEWTNENDRSGSQHYRYRR